MMRSLFSGVSGLKNHQTRMDVIGNNISNVNTTGFKSGRATFSDLFSQTLTGASAPQGNLGGTNAKQIGLGSSVSSIDLLFTNGSVNSTGVNTDLALSSDNSLFILDTGGGSKAYTRNGDFQFDADGNYVQAGNGYFVQGWMADANGEINTNGGVTNITIPSGKSMEPVASTSISYSNNLNSEEEVGKEIPTLSTLYDSLGADHEVTLIFKKTASNTWEISCLSPLGDDDPTTATLSGTTTLSFKDSGTWDSGAPALTLTLSSGAASPLAISTIDLQAMTQFASGSTVAAKADGCAAGTLESVSIDRTGTITGNYTNGMKKVEAQVALQRFTNPGGLTKIGDSLYEESNNSGKSGEPNTAAALGAKLTPAALELSNVDVANEFTDMIVTQRGFQSNSKIITVSDEMLETIVNMKR